MFHLIKTTVLPPMFYLINIDSVTPFVFFMTNNKKQQCYPLSLFHPFQLRNWTPQAMLYLKGASKLHINLTLRLTKNGRYRTVIMICLNIRITTMGQIAMAGGMAMK
uniref:Uncharacterized protein n=1 Tax=Gadus morhua TaxID=8049 RepID=A0A8C5AWG8_GADMO